MFNLAERLPACIHSITIEDVGDLDVHCLLAGQSSDPLLLLLHGFPELNFSWRKIMPALAQLGYFVVAPDQRGYGRTRAASLRGRDTGWTVSFDTDFSSSSLCRMAGDARNLVAALGYSEVHAVIGHDFGSPVAGVCALLRPDIFKSVVLMSSPFAGAPNIQVSRRIPKLLLATSNDTVVSQHSDNSPAAGKLAAASLNIPEALSELSRPRVHYQWYYSEEEANNNMWKSAGSLKSFLRNYYHHKSADWSGNTIFPLDGLNATQLAKLPTYYVMDAGMGMVETVAEHAPSVSEVDSCQWLGDSELEVYVAEYQRTGFQGGLQSYRCNTSGLNTAELQIYRGKSIDVPSLFVAGCHDWGVYQFPGDIETLQTSFTTDFRGTHLVEGAGHWVQQEQPDAVLGILQAFLGS